jgi:hypothetical protein
MSIKLGLLASSQQQAAPLLLNAYPGATVAYSLRKLRTAYTGFAIRVRRSSDNTEMDIGFVNDYVDSSTISTFCGSGNGFVTTWYDQSGNGKNGLQTTTANQPQIYFSGFFVYRSGKIYIKFANNQTLAFLTEITRAPNQNYTFWITYEKNATGNQAVLMSGSNYLWLDYGANQYYNNQENINITPNNYAINTTYLVNHISDTSNVTIYRNNIALGSKVTTANAGFTYICINAFRTATITMAEFVFYSSSQAANRTAINTNINSYYSIY